MMNRDTAAGQVPGDLREELVEKICTSFSRYYNVNRNPDLPEIDVMAEFHLHDEQYFLVRAARISEADENEFVYFAIRDSLDPERLAQLCELTWEHGLAKARPGSNHRSSDVTLVILARNVTMEAAGAAGKWKRSKSYRFGFWGYSHFRLIVYDLGADTCVTNPMGSIHRRAICNMIRNR